MTEVEKQSNVSEDVDKKVEESASEEVPTTDASEQENNTSTEESPSIQNEDEISQLETDIIRQIEYYFGDSNLQRDKFLLGQISKDEEGWVPFSVLLKFKRLAALSTDVDVIVNALVKSDEGLIEISDDKTKIRRHPERPIPKYNEEIRKEISSRTAYVKGFPLQSDMSELIDFFKPYEKVLNIYMRKYLDKPTKTYKFKGSVFVTFATKEQCENFINKDKVQYKERELIRKWQEKYFEEKKEEYEKIMAKKNKKIAKKEENKFSLPKGTVLHFEGCDENTTRETIKEAFVKLEADVAYIEYVKGNKSGHIRLTTENAAQAILDKLEDKKLKVGEVELNLRTLTEDEEKTFLQNAADHMKSKRNHQNKHKNRKRRTSEKFESEPPIKQNKD